MMFPSEQLISKSKREIVEKDLVKLIPLVAISNIR